MTTKKRITLEAALLEGEHLIGFRAGSLGENKDGNAGLHILDGSQNGFEALTGIFPVQKQAHPNWPAP